jgi:hypothetical protein
VQLAEIMSTRPNPEFIECYGCKALVEDKAGQPHNYFGTIQGCWDLYGQILAKEYGEFNYPELTHRLTVDTYAVQHPGQPGRQSTQSVNIHLLSLYFVLVKKLSGKEATRKMGEILAKEPNLEWLEPPVPNGQKTVIDVLTASSQEEHEMKVREWAEDVWSCWYSKHKNTVEKLVEDNF